MEELSGACVGFPGVQAIRKAIKERSANKRIGMASTNDLFLPLELKLADRDRMARGDTI